jgi:hypothetical protein
MDMIANPVLFGSGLAAVLLGLWLFMRSGRSVVDDARDAAWNTVKSRDLKAVRDQLEGTVSEIAGDGSLSGSAKSIAGMAAREAATRIKRMLGLILILGGLLLAALGALWR